MTHESDGLEQDNSAATEFTVFTPHIAERAEFIYSQSGRFSHYTSAEAALSILSGRMMWLRNAMTMNDFSEIEYGIGLVNNYFGPEDQNPLIKRFWSLIEVATNGEASSLSETFQRWIPDSRTQTYVSCLSEHRSNEDLFGRLSMWRGYGKSAGVCVVFNGETILQQAPNANVFTYPIFYCDESHAKAMFEQTASSILDHENFVRQLPQDTLRWWLLNVFQSFVFTLKHPGFSEESEWRLIHRPTERPSSILSNSVMSVNGVPQKVFQLPLRSYSDDGTPLIEPTALIDRIIIGPSDHPSTIWHAFVECLRDLGFTDAEQRVHCSDIPLRSGT